MKFIKHNNNTGLLSLSIKIVVFVLILLSISSNVYAQTGYTLLEPLPCIPGGGVECEAGTQITSPNFETYVQYIFNLAIALAAVASVFMIVWGGFQYMSTDSFSGKSEGLKKVQNAVYGLLLILCSYLILKTIDPRLVELPSTLVAPLDLKCPTNKNIQSSDPLCKGSASNFFDQLVIDAQKYQLRISTLGETNIQARQEVDRLAAERNKLEDDLDFLYNAGYGDSDPEVKLIKSKLASNANDSVKASSLIPISAVTIDMVGTLKQTTDELGKEMESFSWYTKNTTEVERLSAVIEANRTRVNAMRDSGNKALLERGLAIDTAGGINDTANYAEIVLDLMKSDIVVGKTIVYSGGKSAFSYKENKVLPIDVVRSQILNDIGVLEQKINSNVKDPTLKSDLESKLQTSKGLIDRTLPEKE